MFEIIQCFSDHTAVGNNQENENASAKQRHTSLVENKTTDQLPANEAKTKTEQNQEGKQTPVIPGLGIYSDSSDSDTSDSDE